MRDMDQIITSFRETGLKITPQRLSILKLLQGNRSHPSAEEVYREVLRIHPSISFTTVYKTLQTLRDMGEIRELCIDPERLHYDPETREHAHTFCTACKALNDLDSDMALEELLPGSMTTPEGFQVHSIQVHMVGLCAHCA